METNYQPQEKNLFDEYPRETPSGLNTLTILTFIGCGITYLTTLWGLVSRKDPQKSIEELQDARDKMDGSGFGARWIDASIEMMQKGEKYTMLNTILALVFTTLCLVGALRMRKLRKSGFSIYAFGELAPIPVMFAFFGFNMVAMVTGGITALIAVLFTILYARQRKHLIRD